MFVTTMEHQRRHVLLLHLPVYLMVYLPSIMVLLHGPHQEQLDFTSNGVHAFIATSTSSRIRKPSSQRQLQNIVASKVSLLLASSDHPNRNSNNSSGSSNIDSTTQPKQQEQERVLSNQQGKREMINSIMAQPPIYSEGDTVMDINSNIIPIIDDSTHELINCIVMAADGRKADNIVALYVAHMTTMASVLVVVSGNSRPQNQAICAAIRTAVSEINTKQTTDSNNPDEKNKSYYQQPSIEGTAESGWMILDYGSVMVHVMTPKSRLFYNVEGKWKQPQPMISSPGSSASTTTTTVMTTAIPLDLSNMLVPNTATVTSNMLLEQQQQQQRERRMYDGSDENDEDKTIPNMSIDNEFETDQNEVEDENEEELDPFWS